ncbi:MocR-like pyridoxine biosynthesis transcription factor PdxR [Rhodococcus opacus]|uniref:MocR-like pyridoxine biosynthesis transcription factor PdxR n=1 Tax=Rhodococcus TaxID=1827 RepID=UPI001B30F832|nr:MULTISPECIES: PLP-dependent aminotransferase family protein [Rhodococcus]MDI9937626.1 PLP-dependent aminotransferase family protein [Rhodococcus sp. IEGM 1351]
MPRTLIEVDRNSAEPLYRQVRRAIEHGIANGLFDPRHRLPSSRELAVDLAISRNTINLAYQELIAEGLVQSHQRSGMFVNPDMIETLATDARATIPRIDWSSRIRRYPDADVPHIEKNVDWHSYPYPFLAGQIDIRSFPARAWVRCLRDALYQPHAYASLQDSVGADDPMLIDMIRQHLLPSRGIEASADEVLVTVGSQQGLDLVGRVLLGPEDRVAIENPGYLDARHIFLRTGAQVYGIDVDDRGLRPPETLRGTDLMYLTPSHHHPTNATLGIDRRQRLLQLAAESGTVIVEDDYDSEFRYHGSPSPALKALDSSGDAVYLGTFSKFLAPGLRLGYLVGPAELVRELRKARRYVLRHPPGHQQRALAMLIDSGEYHRALRHHRTQMKHKWERLCAAVDKYLPWPQEPYPPGGVSLWMTGPENLDCRVLVREAEARGVLIERGDIFFTQPVPPRNHFRIGYGAIPLRSIEEGIALLGQACQASFRFGR